MKRENLYIVGGALLASTALTSAASAATYTLTTTVNNATLSATPIRLSAQTFPASPATTTQLGPMTLVTRFTGPLAATFSATINVTGAKFSSGTVTANDVSPLNLGTFSGTSSTSATTATTLGCAVAFSADALILSSCNPSSGSFASIGGFAISGVAFDNATAMATAGSSISLNGTITIGSSTLDNTPAQAVVTSASGLVTSSASLAAITSMNVSATPAFANLGSATALSVQIVSGAVTTQTVVARDLRTDISTLPQLIGAANSLQVNSTIFSDDALARTELVFNNVVAATASPTVFTGGFVTFGNIAATNLQTFAVNVVFNGTAAIDNASAGTYALTFAAQAGSGLTGNIIAPPVLSGSSAAFTRGGLNIDINSIQPSVGQGARTYTSILRVVNTSSTAAGTVTIVLRNNESGVVLGTYTSPSIPAGGSAQLTAANLEAGAGITPTATVLYKASISGAIQGYVQHVNWNQDAGFFTDLSGRRNSTNGTNN
jgi:hypothetical protein